MESMTRKGFLSAAAAMGVMGAASSVALAAESAGKDAKAGSGTDAKAMTEVAPGTMGQTLDELNAMRQAHIDAATEYTCADGTVIPEVYVKLRACVEGYGLGVGSENNDHSFDFFMAYWTPEEAQAYIEMPLGVAFTAADNALFTSETPFYYPVPVNQSVLPEGEEILPLDDWNKIIDRNEIIGVSICQCRLRRVLQGQITEGCNHPMDTCMTFGEEAQYYIENNLARQINKDEARAILQRNVDLGMVIQCAYSKASEVICSCHGDCCDILSTYVALGAEGCEAINSMPQVSHYNLVVDTETCIQCGSCVDRCPLYAITMTDEGPVVDAKCVRCGQCATVCPTSSRKLTVKDSFPELPQDMLEDYNLKASYRFTHGIVHE